MNATEIVNTAINYVDVWGWAIGLGCLLLIRSILVHMRKRAERRALASRLAEESKRPRRMRTRSVRDPWMLSAGHRSSAIELTDEEKSIRQAARNNGLNFRSIDKPVR